MELWIINPGFGNLGKIARQNLSTRTERIHDKSREVYLDLARSGPRAYHPHGLKSREELARRRSHECQMITTYVTFSSRCAIIDHDSLCLQVHDLGLRGLCTIPNVVGRKKF